MHEFLRPTLNHETIAHNHGGEIIVNHIDNMSIIQYIKESS